MKHTAESVSAGRSLRGKTALVTGASAGLGAEAARVLALRGADVLLACRSVERGDEAVRAFGASLGADELARCAVRPCDLARLASVRALLEALRRERRTIDRVFLNAGVFGLPFELTEEGFERSYASNYLGHFLLLHGLWTGGMLAPDARVILTMSEGPRLNPFSRAAIELAVRPAEHQSAYSANLSSPNSKVLLALMMAEFPRRAQGTSARGVTVNAGEPGVTLTNNIHQGSALVRFFGRLVGPAFFQPVGEGAAVLLWLATSPECDGKTGGLYLRNLREKSMPARCTDPKVAAEAWDATARALGLTDPRAVGPSA